jgi:hypothetical protein
MSGTSRCISGIAENGASIRLLPNAGGHWDTSAPFQVGEIWELQYAALASPARPHVEDVVVSQQRRLGIQPALRAHLLGRVTPWQGSTDSLFDGMVGYTASNNGYVAERLGIPSRSIWFWIPDRDLSLRADGRHYDYSDGLGLRGLAYVGEPAPVATISAGSLVRVSLARWWKPPDADPDFEERCYVQLSGWYP